MLVVSNGGRVNNSLGNVGSSSSSNNSVLVTGLGSVWSNSGGFALAGMDNSLRISGGGQVVVLNGFSTVGSISSSSNNSVLVTGPGSVWSNSSRLIVGFASTSSSLVISNGGQVFNNDCYLGQEGGSHNNSVVVTGPNSVWTNRGGVLIGLSGAGTENSLLISDGAHVFSNPSGLGDAGLIGYASDSNNVLITGTGSVWSVNGSFAVSGNSFTHSPAAANSLTIGNGGQLFDSTGILGYDTGNNNSSVLVTGFGSIWSNANSLSIGGSRNSLVISNGGKVVNNSALVGASSFGGSNSVHVIGGGVWQNNLLYVGYL